jgi:threonine dehydrogenase-like Zn-dependent dehydrogenase
VNSIGAKYVSAQQVPVKEFAKTVGHVDLVYEALGVAGITFDVLKILGLNGVFVFTGIPPHKPAIPVEADSLMRGMVLKNQVIVGTVNADRPAFENAIRDLGVFKERWPKAIASVISGRFPIDAYRELLLGKATGIKNVITIGS